jgi:hypothetical protein
MMYLHPALSSLKLWLLAMCLTQVKDLSFFDEIMLSRTMFTDHLLSSYLAALRDVATTGSRTRTKTKKK